MADIKSFYSKPNIHETSGHTVNAPIRQFLDYQESIESSTADFGGTIAALTNKIDDIYARLESVSFHSDPEKIISESQIFKSEITELKSTVFPKLEESQKALENVTSFLNYTSSFLSDLISANGRLNGIQGEINSITRRLDNLEKVIDRNWQNITTIVSIIIAIAAVVVTIFF